MGVAKNKSDPISRNTTYMKSPIKERQRSFKYRFNICLFRPFFVFFAKEMIDHFHHSGKVTLLLKLAGINIYQRKEFISIYKVEISGKSEIACRDYMALKKRMTKLNIIFSLCTVTKVPEQQLCHKLYVTL